MVSKKLWGEEKKKGKREGRRRESDEFHKIFIKCYIHTEKLKYVIE